MTTLNKTDIFVKASELREFGVYNQPLMDMWVKVSEERKHNFEPVTNGFTCDQAACESGRCLQCDLRLQIQRPRLWTEFEKKEG